MSLILLPNRETPSLLDAGSLSLKGNTIRIKLAKNSIVFLQRDGKLIKLFETSDFEKNISGPAKVGDIYTLGKGEEKLVVRISEKTDIPLRFHDLTTKTDQGKKTTLTAGIMLVLVLCISVFFGIKQKRQKDFISLNNSKLEKANLLYKESMNLFELDKTQSRQKFIQAAEIVDEIEKTGYENENLDLLKNDINQNKGQILGEYRVTAEEFLDLTLQTSGFTATDVSSSGEEMFVYDSTVKKVLQINLKTKNTKLFADEKDLEGTKNIGSYENRFFVEKDDGIYEITRTGKTKVLSKDWNDGIFYVYSANIYYLDKKENKIYRFAGSSSGFGSKSDWIAPGIEADFSLVSDMVIDGSIWLISSSGKVAKFSLGTPQSVSLNGLPGQLSSPQAIYTNDELENVYILDVDNSRVVVLDKKGNFVVQYLSDQIKDANGLVVSEEEKKILLFSGSKIVQIIIQ